MNNEKRILYCDKCIKLKRYHGHVDLMKRTPWAADCHYCRRHRNVKAKSRMISVK